MNSQNRFLWQQVERWAEVDPAFPALRTGEEVITYGEFEKRSDNLAKQFLHLGIKKGDTIVTMLPCSLEYIITLIAADKIGAIVVPMDVKFKKADLERFVDHIRPVLIVSVESVGNKSVVEIWKEVSKSLKNSKDTHYVFTGSASFGYSFTALTAESLPLDSELGDAKLNQEMDDGLLIVFTGGTTGVPKAALLSKRNVAVMAAVEAEILGKYVPGRIKTIASLPPSHVGGTVEMIGMAIAGGFDIIIHDSWSPHRVLETIQRERVPWIGGVPTMFAIMLLIPEIGQFDLTCLKIAILSGEKVESDLIRLIKEKICPNVVIGYGSTEAGSEVTFTELSDRDLEIASGYVGKPLPGVVISIRDTDGKELSAGEKGEVVIKSPFTIQGYFRMPGEDEAGFTDDGFCKSGDLGYLTPDGGLYIKGRIKHIIRVGSYTVMPAEVEDVLTQGPGVAMAAVIGVPDKVYGELAWAVVSPYPGHTIDVENLTALCTEKLASFKVPKKIIVWENLPITRLGKVHRVEVQDKIREMISNNKIQ